MTESLFAVRNATVDDIGALTELRALLLDGTGASYSSRTPEGAAKWRAAYRSWLSSILGMHDNVQVLVAEHRESGQLVGCATGIIDIRAPTSANPNGLAGWVQSVAVDARWRGRGIANQLMHVLLRWFTKRDVATIALQTTDGASRLYEKLGFIPSGECLLVRQEVQA